MSYPDRLHDCKVKLSSEGGGDMFEVTFVSRKVCNLFKSPNAMSIVWGSSNKMTSSSRECGSTVSCVKLLVKSSVFKFRRAYKSTRMVSRCRVRTSSECGSCDA